MKKIIMLLAVICCIGLLAGALGGSRSGGGGGVLGDLIDAVGGDEEKPQFSDAIRNATPVLGCDMTPEEVAAWNYEQKSAHKFDFTGDQLKVTGLAPVSGSATGDCFFSQATNSAGYGSKVAFSVDVRRTSASVLESRVNIKVGDGGVTTDHMSDVAVLEFKANGDVVAGVDRQYVCTLSEYQNTNLGIVFYVGESKADIYVNGDLLAAGVQMQSSGDYDRSVRLFYFYASAGVSANQGAEIILDNIETYQFGN